MRDEVESSRKQLLDELEGAIRPGYEPIIFIGRVSSAIPLLFQRNGLRKKEFLYYLDLCGVRSLPIVLAICFLMGAVLAINGQIQLSKVGTEIYVVDAVGFSVLKVLGPLMVAIMATGRAGSAFAAEIGTMKVDEEISALATLGISPEAYLVLPKLLAMLVALPVHLSSHRETVPVEIQLRTIAMDSWAALEHELQYKNNASLPQRFADQLRMCAETASVLDCNMQSIMQQIDDWPQEESTEKK